MLQIELVEARDTLDREAVLGIVLHNLAVARNAVAVHPVEQTAKQSGKSVGIVLAHMPRIARQRHGRIGRGHDKRSSRTQHAVHLADEIAVAPYMLYDLKRHDEVEAAVSERQSRHDGAHEAYIGQAQRLAVEAVFVDRRKTPDVRRDYLDAVPRARTHLQHVAVHHARGFDIGQLRATEDEVVRPLARYSLGALHAIDVLSTLFPVHPS